MRRIVLLTLVLLAPATPLFGWGEKGHLIANEAAARVAPVELPPFFHQAYPQLIWLGPDPDRWRGAGESADAMYAPEHFLDYEYVLPLGELPRERYAYIDLLHRSGTARNLGLTTEAPGFVVWKVAEVAELLTQEFRLWRREADEVARRQLEQSIVFLAGTLGHYVADSANPHHSTIHYNGWVGDPSKGYRTDCGAHSRFESAFVSNAVELDDVLKRLRPLEVRDDFFATALDLIRDSNAQVEPLYALDAAGAFDDRGTGEGQAFAADRIALGASVLRDLWVSAWRKSGERR